MNYIEIDNCINRNYKLCVQCVISDLFLSFVSSFYLSFTSLHALSSMYECSCRISFPAEIQPKFAYILFNFVNILSVAGQNWGRVDNCRFDCCFICVDAAIPVLDQYVGQRVDCMIDAGLLGEVYDIYKPNSDYTRGLRQAIGVREFEDFLTVYLSEGRNDKASDPTNESLFMESANKDKILKDNIKEVLCCSDNNELKVVLSEAIDKMKANTRRLVRRQVSLCCGTLHPFWT